MQAHNDIDNAAATRLLSEATAEVAKEDAFKA